MSARKMLDLKTSLNLDRNARLNAHTSCKHFGSAIKIRTMCYRAVVKHVVRLTCKIREYSCRCRVCTGSSHTRRCRPRNSAPWSQVHTCTCSCPRASDTRPHFDRATRHSNPAARNGRLKRKEEKPTFNFLHAHSRYICTAEKSYGLQRHIKNPNGSIKNYELLALRSFLSNDSILSSFVSNEFRLSEIRNSSSWGPKILI